MQYSSIKSIKSLGPSQTIDITVNSNDHLYLANGVVTSNSHSVCYGKITFWSAYAKAHFPNLFITSYLSNASNKADSKEEISTLVNDGRYMGINFISPSIIEKNENFSVFNKTIRFGLGNIAKVGEKKVAEINDAISLAESKLNKKIEKFSWFEILLYISTEINSEVMKNLISMGAFGHLGMYRKLMLFELNKFKILTNKEINTVITSNITNLIDCFKYLLSSGSVNKRRVEKLEEALKILKNPPNELKDSEDWISNVEKQLVGTEITCSKLDSCNTSGTNCKCCDFDKSDMKEYRIAATISKISEYRPKSGKLAGQTMAYITLVDNTGSCDAVMFPTSYEKFDFLVFDGNTICAIGKKSGNGSLQINSLVQL